MFDRWLAQDLQSKLSRPYVHLLFGARQTGKSTLLNSLIPENALRLNFADPQERSRHLAHSGEFAQACRSLYSQRTRDGAEVDFIIERAGTLTPVEVKWTEHPTVTDTPHLLASLDEKPKEARHGYVICRCPRPLRLHDKITALP